MLISIQGIKEKQKHAKQHYYHVTNNTIDVFKLRISWDLYNTIKKNSAAPVAGADKLDINKVDINKVFKIQNF